MKILGIETSCDETAAAVVEDGTKVLSEALASSQDHHVKTGGIIPEIAARKQVESIIPIVNDALASIDKKDVDAIAVTVGPGLIGSLLVGVETAKTLALLWDKPLVPVNHLVAHIYGNWVGGEKLPEFPAIALVVSGGHTDFVLMNGHGNLRWLGGTRDDAAGEAFDKTARLLGLPYPGGPSIAKSAAEASTKEGSLFPRPMVNDNSLDMSFSGLKTSVSNYVKNNPGLRVPEIAFEIQEAIVDTLVAKSKKAVELHQPKSFLLAGGVSANTRLREKIAQALSDQCEVFIPEIGYSTDNAVVIASAAFYNNSPIAWDKIVANPSLAITDHL